MEDVVGNLMCERSFELIEEVMDFQLRSHLILIQKISVANKGLRWLSHDHVDRDFLSQNHEEGLDEGGTAQSKKKRLFFISEKTGSTFHAAKKKQKKH